jgi:hypothetical protein
LFLNSVRQIVDLIDSVLQLYLGSMFCIISARVVLSPKLMMQGTSSKARNILPFLQKQRRLLAIVDYVLSGHRYKLLIPKETCAIAFALSGVRCPGRGEKYSEEAITFMRQRIMQRDVEVSLMLKSALLFCCFSD